MNRPLTAGVSLLIFAFCTTAHAHAIDLAPADMVAGEVGATPSGWVIGTEGSGRCSATIQEEADGSRSVLLKDESGAGRLQATLPFRRDASPVSVLRDARVIFEFRVEEMESPPLGDQRNGRIYCPFMDTYADFQLRGESVEISGLDDPYLRFCASGYGNSNVIGLLKLNTARDIGDEMLYHLAFLKMHGRMLLSGYPEVGSAVYPGEKGEIRDDWWRYVRALQALKESGVGHPPRQ